MSKQKESVLRMPEEIINDMNNNLPKELSVEDLQILFRGRKLKFHVIMSDTLMNSDVCEMELSQRASNALKRAGFATIGDLVNRIEKDDDLRSIRNCGTTSVSEIMGKLFFYNYSLLSFDRRQLYMKELLLYNGIR